MVQRQERQTQTSIQTLFGPETSFRAFTQIKAPDQTIILSRAATKDYEAIYNSFIN